MQHFRGTPFFSKAEHRMFRLKRFPRILISFYIIGYIFAFFALFYQTKWVFAIITFASSALLNVLNVLSDEYRSTKYFIKAKKLIDKGQLDVAADAIVTAARIMPNEDILVQINATVKKNPQYYGKTAELLEQRFKEFDSPFLRFVASSFYYSVHNLNRARDVMIDVPYADLTIKAARLLGSVLYELADYGKAIRVFSPFDPQRTPASEDELAILYGIAICHIAKNESKKAVEFLTRVKAKSPKFGNAENLIRQLEADSGQH